MNQCVVDLFATPPGLHYHFWKLFCWGRLHRHQCLLESSSAEEGCTGTNVYWEAPLLRKAAQAPMLTGKLLCWGRLHRHQCLLGSSSAEEGCTDTNAYWKILWIPSLLREVSRSRMYFFVFCLLTSMKLILIPNCSFIVFAIYSLKSLFLKTKS